MNAPSIGATKIRTSRRNSNNQQVFRSDMTSFPKSRNLLENASWNTEKERVLGTWDEK